MKPATLTLANFRGGVGKSTVAFNLAYELSAKGRRVLLIDFDPQGNLSYWLRDPDGIPLKVRSLNERRSISNVLIPKEASADPATLEQAAYQTRWEGVSAVASNLSFLKAKDSVFYNPFALSFALDELGEGWDYAIVDTRPDLDMRATNAFAAADRIILPIRFDASFQEGLSEATEAINDTCSELRLGRKPYKILPAIVRSTTSRDKRGLSDLDRHLPPSMTFGCSIRDTAKAGESPAEGLALSEYVREGRAGSAAAKDYAALADEVEEWTAELRAERAQANGKGADHGA